MAVIGWFESSNCAYTRAPEVLAQLQAFLGAKKESTTASSNPAEMQRQYFMQRMQMMNQGRGDEPSSPSSAAPAPAQQVRLIANERRNTILVNAPPDQMQIMKELIYKLDVPPDRMGGTESTAQAMRVYRLATADPEVIVNFLDTVGQLDPQTKLDVDKKNRAVVAYASPRDQKTIAALSKTSTDRIDG